MKKLLFLLITFTYFSFALEKIPAVNPSGILIAEPNVVNFHVPPPKSFGLPNAALAQNANIEINFLPANSSDTQWGDHAVEWPVEVSNAFVYAVSIWESIIESSVPITIDAAWVDNLPLGVLGHSGALNYFRDFSGAPRSGTFYPITLANALHGADLDPTQADIYMGFSSTFNWYSGTDGSTPNTKYDLASVVLHEICHGLGFSGSLYVDGGIGKWWWSGYPKSYDVFTEDNSGKNLIDTTVYPENSAALADVLTSSKVYFNGAAANAANGGGKVKLYCPATWQSGSSYSHLDEIFNGTPNALMTYSIGKGESEHSPGTVTLGLLADIGWSTKVTFSLKKFKGKIFWKAGDKFQLGNLKISGSINSSLTDLSFLSGLSTTNLVILNSCLALPCGEFTVNKKGTSAKATLKENDNKVTTKFKLKKGVLYFTYVNKNCENLFSALGINNADTDNWQANSAEFLISITDGCESIAIDGAANYIYKTKQDKKTTFK